MGQQWLSTYTEWCLFWSWGSYLVALQDFQQACQYWCLLLHQWLPDYWFARCLWFSTLQQIYCWTHKHEPVARRPAEWILLPHQEFHGTSALEDKLKIALKQSWLHSLDYGWHPKCWGWLPVKFLKAKSYFPCLWSQLLRSLYSTYLQHWP